MERMKRIKVALVALLVMVSAVQVNAEEKLPPVEVRADRVNIYPQRMELDGEETLMDLIRMYPFLMETGFEGQIETFNLRIDNAPMNGNNRLLLSQIKAKQVSKIQICHNTGVAKGTLGLNGVIDINMLRYEDGAHGFAGAEASTDKMIVPAAELRLGKGKTNLWVNASDSYQDDRGLKDNREYLSAHMTNWLTPHDRLLTYFTQQYLDRRNFPMDVRTKGEKYMGRARYFHNFNDKGTELLMVAGYQYSDDTKLLMSDESVRTDKYTRTALGIVELNTPLFTPNLSMILGWEGDLTTTDYRISNNDIYLQFDYHTGAWRFTVGDRIMFYRYKYSQASASKDYVHDDARNNMLASLIFAPGNGNQFQAGYYRKFINPSYDAVTGQAQYISDDEWLLFREGIREQNIQELKFGYTYSARPDLCVSLTANHYDLEDEDPYWRFGVTGYFKTGHFSMTAGAYRYEPKRIASNMTYHLAPSVTLKGGWKLSAEAIAYMGSSGSNPNEVYGSFNVQKTFGKHLLFWGQWHDMFEKEYSAALFGLSIRY